MKKLSLLVFIIAVGAFVFLFATGRIDLKKAKQNIDKAVSKTLKPVTRPVEIKQKTHGKLDKMEEDWQDKHNEILDDVGRYK